LLFRVIKLFLSTSMEMFIVLSDSTCGRWCSPAHFYWLKSVSKAADGVTKAFPNVANSHMNSFQKAAATSIVRDGHGGGWSRKINARYLHTLMVYL
jgi:hypothetical protein